MPYVSPYGPGLYGSGNSVWLNPYPLGYPDTGMDTDTTDSDNTAAAPNQTDNSGEYNAASDEENPPPYPGPYPAPSALPAPPPAPAMQEAVTIVFKDGRPAEQIHNYILTRSKLIVGDGPRREIPTDQLDLAATAKANQDTGVDFHLPGISQ